MEYGYIKLHRRILGSRVFLNEGLLKVWIWCLLRANHQETWETIKTGRGVSEIHLAPGQFIFGRKSASQKLRMHESTIWKRMGKLKKAQKLNIESNTHYSIITILNWGSYQGNNKKSNTESNRQVTTKEQPSNTDKNVKNVKNDKKYIENSFKFQKAVPIPDDFHLTEQMENYAKRKGFNIDLEDFTESFILKCRGNTSKYKYTDWYATWQNWLKNKVEWAGAKSKDDGNLPKEFNEKEHYAN